MKLHAFLISALGESEHVYTPANSPHRQPLVPNAYMDGLQSQSGYFIGRKKLSLLGTDPRILCRPVRNPDAISPTLHKLPVSGYRGRFSPGYLTIPSSSQIRNEWNYISNPQYAYLACMDTVILQPNISCLNPLVRLTFCFYLTKKNTLLPITKNNQFLMTYVFLTVYHELTIY